MDKKSATGRHFWNLKYFKIFRRYTSPIQRQELDEAADLTTVAVMNLDRSIAVACLLQVLFHTHGQCYASSNSITL